jgi:hypothetical protein
MNKGEYLFLFRCGHKLFENGHIVLNKHSKNPGGKVGTLLAPQNGEYKLYTKRKDQER